MWTPRSGSGATRIELLRRLGGAGRLVGLDRDAQALEIARERLERVRRQGDFGARELFEHRRSSDGAGIGPADGVLADLGVSSMQLDSPSAVFRFVRAVRWTCGWTRAPTETAVRHCEHGG